MGELTVVEDADIIGALRIKMVSDKGQTLCNHVICQQHTLQK